MERRRELWPERPAHPTDSELEWAEYQATAAPATAEALRQMARGCAAGTGRKEAGQVECLVFAVPTLAVIL